MPKKEKKPAFSWYRWQMRPRLYDEDLTPHNEAEDMQKKDEEPIELEKGDLFAMILSAMLTIFPICVIVLVLAVGLAYLLFFH